VAGVKSAYHDRAAAERGKHRAVRADLLSNRGRLDSVEEADVASRR
jgi:hypothetical protein